MELRLDEVQKEHSSLQKVKKKKIEQEKRIDKSKEAHMRNDIKFPDIGIVKSRIHFAVQRVAVNGKVFANKYDSPLNVLNAISYLLIGKEIRDIRERECIFKE